MSFNLRVPMGVPVCVCVCDALTSRSSPWSEVCTHDIFLLAIGYYIMVLSLGVCYSAIFFTVVNVFTRASSS